MTVKDKRHREVIKKIKLLMADVANDLMVDKTMPVLDVPKVGYDNTIWSKDKRMLTIGDKTVQVSPDSKKNSNLLPISRHGKRNPKVAR
ncbi:hypothetical protein [Nitrososphaera sp. AFS]|uniref:hypothetical protein n=1 Tax=Nitrososphaera sp. AFS TaxID=2301191 RepID=UPI0013922BFA|nr:hypothetical protein [Nitrososphaera sp. AFS]NAL76673.1 hypothetical protein [Nitrososphaera sp. AFS]